METGLGWVLSGPAPTDGSSQHSFLTTTHVFKIGSSSVSNDQESLEKLLQSFWDLESLGITGKEKTLYDNFCDTIKTRDGRYEVSLPWLETHRPLPDNYLLSFKRLQSLLRRLRQSPELLHQYDDVIKDQLKQGIIEPCTKSDSALGTCHYLPHHAVVRKDKTTTKLRIVYDASARAAKKVFTEQS